MVVTTNLNSNTKSNGKITEVTVKDAGCYKELTFQLILQCGQVLKAKIFNRCCILLVGLGGPTLI